MVAESGGIKFLRQSISGTGDNQSPQSRHYEQLKVTSILNVLICVGFLY